MTFRILSKAEQCDELKELINELEYEVQKEKNQNEDLEKALKDNETTINLLNDKLSEKDEEINNLNNVIYKLNDDIKHLKEKTFELEKFNEDIKIEHEQKLTAKVGELKKTEVRQLASDLKKFLSI